MVIELLRTIAGRCALLLGWRLYFPDFCDECGLLVSQPSIFLASFPFLPRYVFPALAYKHWTDLTQSKFRPGFIRVPSQVSSLN